MSEAPQREMSLEAFLAWDGEGSDQWQLIDGIVHPREITSMAPAKDAHNELANAFGAELRLKLRGRRPPCRVSANAGVPIPGRKSNSFLLADVAVKCGPASDDYGPPTVVVEILSPSTRTFDRGRKLDLYRSVETITDILLADTSRRRVQHWHRQGEGWFVLDIVGDGTIALDGLTIRLPLAELYAGLLPAALPDDGEEEEDADDAPTAPSQDS